MMSGTDPATRGQGLEQSGPVPHTPAKAAASPGVSHDHAWAGSPQLLIDASPAHGRGAAQLLAMHHHTPGGLPGDTAMCCSPFRNLTGFVPFGAELNDSAALHAFYVDAAASPATAKPDVGADPVCVTGEHGVDMRVQAPWMGMRDRGAK